MNRFDTPTPEQTAAAFARWQRQAGRQVIT